MAALTPALLTVESVAAYVDARSAEIGVFAPGTSLSAKAITGGNVNFGQKSLQHALPSLHQHDLHQLPTLAFPRSASS